MEKYFGFASEVFPRLKSIGDRICLKALDEGQVDQFCSRDYYDLKLKGEFSFNLFEDEPNSSAYHGSNESDVVMVEVGINELEK